MSKQTRWILVAAALAVALVAGLSGLALSMGMGTGGGMHRGGMMGPGMMGGGRMGPGMMDGRTWGGPGAYDNGGPGGVAVPDRTGNPVEDTPESIARGRAAYQERCVACHGPQGRGDGLAAASLPRPPADLQALAGRRPDQQVYTTLTYGWGAMPSFAGSLGETQRWDVVNYLQHLREASAQR